MAAFGRAGMLGGRRMFHRPDRSLVLALSVWLLVTLGLAGTAALYLRRQ